MPANFGIFSVASRCSPTHTLWAVPAPTILRLVTTGNPELGSAAQKTRDRFYPLPVIPGSRLTPRKELVSWGIPSRSLVLRHVVVCQIVEAKPAIPNKLLVGVA